MVFLILYVVEFFCKTSKGVHGLDIWKEEEENIILLVTDHYLTKICVMFKYRMYVEKFFFLVRMIALLDQNPHIAPPRSAT